MATEEITISELELTEELASDNLIPVESTTDTKATSLQILKNWLSSFFVGKTGEETIGGAKHFTSPIFREGVIDTAGTTLITLSGRGGEGSTRFLAYYVKNSGIYGRIQSINNISGKHVYLDVLSRDDGTGIIQVGGSSNNKIVDFRTVNAVKANTPSSTSNDSDVATTAWVWNSGAVVKEKSFAGNGYIKFSSGLIMQWGNDTCPNTVTFPTPFTDRPQVLITPAENKATDDTRVSSVNTITTTSFGSYRFRSEARKFNWFAIGY